MITREQFLQLKERRFSQTNPELMENPFWQWMAWTKEIAYAARKQFGFTEGEHVFDTPVWCFNRFGMTETHLPDGRVIYIGGEHEDYYDPDFCIYNDVIVRQPNGAVEIYGYPFAAFIPTDFHTATLVGKAIYIVGCLGYQEHRRFALQHDSEQTQVYRLDCTTYEITEVTTTGERPGWISRHEAVFDELATLQWRKIGETEIKAELLEANKFRIQYAARQELLAELGEDAECNDPDGFARKLTERFMQKYSLTGGT
jgi:hypothetical protein